MQTPAGTGNNKGQGVKPSRSTTWDLSSGALEEQPLIGSVDVKGHSYCPNGTQAGSEVVGNKYPKSFFFILQISPRASSALAKSNPKLKHKGSWVIHLQRDVSRAIKQDGQRHQVAL